VVSSANQLTPTWSKLSPPRVCFHLLSDQRTPNPHVTHHLFETYLTLSSSENSRLWYAFIRSPRSSSGMMETYSSL
jgi:hypothetical protein